MMVAVPGVGVGNEGTAIWKSLAMLGRGSCAATNICQFSSAHEDSRFGWGIACCMKADRQSARSTALAPLCPPRAHFVKNVWET